MQRRELLALSALVLVALGLRLGVALVPRCIATDGVAYLELAEQIAAGEGWHHPMFPPGYPLLVAAAHGLTGIPFERSALLVSAICGALVLLPAYAFWRRALGARAALAAAALLAVWPLSIDLGGSVLSESASLLGIFAGLYAWERSRDQPDWAAAAGGSWGAVAWMRPEVLAWSAVGALLLGVRGRVGRATLLVVVSALVYLPYVVVLHAQTGVWQLSAKADANLVFAQMVGQPDRQRAYESLADGLQAGTADASLPGPTGLTQRVWANAGHSLRLATRIWPPVLLALVAIGAFLGWRQRRLGDWIWLAVLAAAPILLLFVKPRFFYASSAVLLGLAGLAVAYTRGVRLWAVAALAALLLVPQALRPLHGEDRHGAWRAAGLWLAAQPGPATTVIDRKPFVAYYADRPHAWPPPRPGLAGLREQLSAHESVVLVVDNRYFARSRPDWFEALASPPPWLEELARFRGPGGHEVRLLRAHAELAGAGGPAAGVKRGSDAPG